MHQGKLKNNAGVHKDLEFGERGGIFKQRVDVGDILQVLYFKLML